MIYNDLVIPKSVKNGEVEGTVIIAFIVEGDGTTSDYRIVREIGGGCGDVALETVKNLQGRWKPGLQGGKPIRFQYILPIGFKWH